MGLLLVAAVIVVALFATGVIKIPSGTQQPEERKPIVPEGPVEQPNIPVPDVTVPVVTPPQSDAKGDKHTPAELAATNLNIVVTGEPARGGEYAGGGGGAEAKQLMCPRGTAVTTLGGSSGWYVDALNFGCGVGGSVPIEPQPGFGYGSGGGSFQSDRCDQGFDGFKVRAGQWLDSIKAICGGVAGPSHGGSGGKEQDVMCPAGKAVVGVYGRAGDYVDRLGVLCAPRMKS